MPKILKSTDKIYVELDLEMIPETERAIRVSDGIITEWIPKSFLKNGPEQIEGGLVRIVIPEWLAQEKGFI